MHLQVQCNKNQNCCQYKNEENCDSQDKIFTDPICFQSVMGFVLKMNWMRNITWLSIRDRALPGFLPPTLLDCNDNGEW